MQAGTRPITSGIHFALLQDVLAEARALKDVPQSTNAGTSSSDASHSTEAAVQSQAAAQKPQAAPRRHATGPNARAQAIQASVQVMLQTPWLVMSVRRSAKMLSCCLTQIMFQYLKLASVAGL